MPAVLLFGTTLVAASLAVPAGSFQAPAPVPPLPPQTAPGAETASNPNARVFGAPAGIIFNLIKTDKAADFELVMGKLRTALTTNPDPVRKKQGEGWKVYKAAEPYQGHVLYVFVIDPAVPGADYTISKILAEMYPSEVQDLYVKFRDAYGAGQTLWNLLPVGASVKPPK
jgi:hypothetical protein